MLCLLLAFLACGPIWLVPPTHSIHHPRPRPLPQITDYAAAKAAIKKKCVHLEQLLNQELAVQQILAQQEEKFQNIPDLSTEEKKLAVDTLQLQRRQLDKAQGLVNDTLKILGHTLHNITYLDFRHMKATAHTMHKVLAESALEAEELHNAIEALHTQHIAAATQKQKSNLTQHTGLDDVLHFLLRDITESVDKLQDQLHGHETQTFEKEKKTEGAQLETVVKINPSDPHPKGNQSAVKGSGDQPGKAHESKVVTLIDSKNNQYTLRRPTDTTLHYEDISLTNDIILVLVMAFIGGAVFSTIGLPTFFGYLTTGVILSPTGMNRLENIVQVETLSGFGVFFILFLLGLEFSLPKLMAIWRVAVFGGGFLMLINVAITLLVCYTNATSITAGILLGFCICLSSTAIVVKCLEPQEAVTRYGSALLGILIVQDVALGVMLALLPVLQSAGGTTLFQALSSIVMGFLLIGLVATGVSWRLLPQVLRYLRPSKELSLLCAISVMLSMLKLTEYLGLSMELGCFIAGLMISAQHEQAEYTMEVMEPVRDMFSCIFFVTMGLHIYPSFLLSEVGGLLTLTIMVVGTKYVVAFLLFAFYYHYDYAVASLIAIGLSQVSEFAFVLASHGRKLEVISREVYFLLLGTTALSFLSTPFLWRLSKHFWPPQSGVHFGLDGGKADGRTPSPFLETDPHSAGPLRVRKSHSPLFMVDKGTMAPAPASKST